LRSPRDGFGCVAEKVADDGELRLPAGQIECFGIDDEGRTTGSLERELRLRSILDDGGPVEELDRREQALDPVQQAARVVMRHERSQALPNLVHRDSTDGDAT